MSDGTLQTLDVTMLDDVGTGANQLIQLDSNAKIPVCSGAALTNLPGVTKNASDPVIATNPSGGVGSVWQNTTSGNMFICTDATAGANVWTNIGAGTGDIKPAYWIAENYGYMMGGAPNPLINHIQRYPFASSSDAVDVANLTVARGFCCGNSSATYGYACGGSGPTNVIDKHQFGTTNNATDVGDLVANKSDTIASSSETYGFVAGGYPSTNTIQKFSFASDGNTTDHGDLTGTRQGGNTGGINSETHGYTSGGSGSSTQRDKYAFASNVTAVDDGNHTAGHHGYANGCSSVINGYMVGGNVSGGGSTNIIDKFAFAAGGQSTDVGDLTQGGYTGGHASTADYGYKGGGGDSDQSRIEKFTFASDNNSVDTTASMLSLNGTNQSYAYGASAQY